MTTTLAIQGRDVTKKRDLALLCGLGGIVAAVFLPLLFVGFMSDDFDVFTSVTKPLSAIFDRFPAGGYPFFRPFTLLLFRIEYQLFVNTQLFHHAVNPDFRSVPRRKD